MSDGIPIPFENPHVTYWEYFEEQPPRCLHRSDYDSCYQRVRRGRSRVLAIWTVAGQWVEPDGEYRCLITCPEEWAWHMASDEWRSKRIYDEWLPDELAASEKLRTDWQTGRSAA